MSGSELAKYQLKKGDIIFNRTNSAELVGKCAVFDSDQDAVFASYLVRFRLKEHVALPKYVAAFINAPIGRRFIESRMTRAIGQVNISASVMAEMPVGVPPLHIQQQVIAELDFCAEHAEKARRAAASALKATRDLEATVLRNAFPASA